MAKDYGADRKLSPGSDAYVARQKEADEMRASGKYSSVEFDKKTGGIMAVEKGKARHKPEEKEAAEHMMHSGYRVVLKDETGEVRTPDGYIGHFTYEQRTPNVGTAKTVSKAMEHAKSKGADVAVVYDKHAVYHRQTIEHGIRHYEQHNSYRLKRIIVISKAGNVYEHVHNDK